MPDDIVEDMHVSLSILCDGYRVISVRDVRIFEPSIPSSKEEFYRKVRISCLCFNVNRLLWHRILKLPPLTLYKYLSHKFIRWFCIYNLAISFLFFEVFLAVSGYGILALSLAIVSAAAIYAGSRWSIPLVSRAVDVQHLLAGAGLGVWRYLKGERFQTWTPAKSIR